MKSFKIILLGMALLFLSFRAPKAATTPLFNLHTSRLITTSSSTTKANLTQQQLIANALSTELKVKQQKRNHYLFSILALGIIVGLIGYILKTHYTFKHLQTKRESNLKETLVKIDLQRKLQEQHYKISQMLHDNVAAQLAFIISSLDNLKYTHKLPRPVDEKLRVLSEFTHATIIELRDAIWALNKDAISLGDLKIRLTNYIEKTNQQQLNFEFETTYKTAHLQLAPIEGLSLYRIIQEGVNNAIKHAHTNQIIVHATSDNERLEIQISDNGIGFDENNVELGNGIENMYKRAHAINCALTINSAVDKGTTIVIELPFKPYYTLTV